MVVKIVDPEIFLREVIGTDSQVEVDEIAELLRRVAALAFSDMVLESGLGAIDLQGRQVQLSDKLREFVAERVDDEFGLGVDSVTMTISLPEEITQAMTRGVARGVEESGFLDNVGPMGRYQQAKAAEAMVAAAGNPGGGAMGDLMGAGMGLALGQQMAGMMGGGVAAAAPAPPPLGGAMFHVEMNGAPAGPYTVAQVQQGIASGQVTASTQVWTTGMPAWAPASNVPVLQGFFATPPPMPGAPVGGPPPLGGPQA
jgi:membrane protease subunit (stomatin/prohibitin family)